MSIAAQITRPSSVHIRKRPLREHGQGQKNRTVRNAVSALCIQGTGNARSKIPSPVARNITDAIKMSQQNTMASSQQLNQAQRQKFM
jgi:hypothetical protein